MGTSSPSCASRSARAAARSGATASSVPTCPAGGASAPRGLAAAGGQNRKGYPVAPAAIFWRGGLYRTASRRGPPAPDHAPAGCGVRYTPLSTHFLSRSSQCDTVYIRLRLTRRLYSRFIKRRKASASFPPPSSAVERAWRRGAAAGRRPVGLLRADAVAPCGQSRVLHAAPRRSLVPWSRASVSVWFHYPKTVLACSRTAVGTRAPAVLSSMVVHDCR